MLLVIQQKHKLNTLISRKEMKIIYDTTTGSLIQANYFLLVKMFFSRFLFSFISLFTSYPLYVKTNKVLILTSICHYLVGDPHDRPSWKVPSHKYGTPYRTSRLTRRRFRGHQRISVGVGKHTKIAGFNISHTKARKICVYWYFGLDVGRADIAFTY